MEQHKSCKGVKIFASLAGRCCRAAQDFRAEQQLCPTSKVKNFVMRPSQGMVPGLTFGAIGVSMTISILFKSLI